MPTKRCSCGKCNSDSRYTDRPHMQNVQFVPFAKPKTNKEKCLRWIKLCGRPHQQLNIDNITELKFISTKVCITL